MTVNNTLICESHSTPGPSGVKGHSHARAVDAPQYCWCVYKVVEPRLTNYYGSRITQMLSIEVDLLCVRTIHIPLGRKSKVFFHY